MNSDGGEMQRKIGAFTHEELSRELRRLAERAAGADREGAATLLPEAQALITKLGEELDRDQEALAERRREADQASAQIAASFDGSDAAREALQARQMAGIVRRLEEAREARRNQSLWLRLTTADEQLGAIESQAEQLASEHDAQDAQDAQAREERLADTRAEVAPFEQEVQGTKTLLDEAQDLVDTLANRAAGFGPGSALFVQVERSVQDALRASAKDMDARAFMAITAALTGTPIEELNAIYADLRQANLRLLPRHRLTDIEALAVLACASASARIGAREALELWCEAVDHANREGGFSKDEDARAMVVFCAALSKREVGAVQTLRRAINVESFRGRDPEGAGLVLLAHTLSERPIAEIVQSYHAAARARMPQEECGYMALAAGLGDRSPEWVIGRYRSLQALVIKHIKLPWDTEERREALREAAAALTVAAAVSHWSDAQLVSLYAMTAPFKPTFGKTDYEARGGLVIGAVAATKGK